MTAPAKELDWKAYVRGELKRWADYINMLRVREITRYSPVGRTIETLFDKKGSRLIIKLKTKDF